MAEPEAGDPRCAWCGNGFAAHDLAWCSSCGRPFHLALRIDVAVTDCGQAWIDDEVEAVRFACYHCLQAEAASGATPSLPPSG